MAARLSDRVADPVTALAWHEVQPDLAAFIAMKVAGAQLMGTVMLFLVAAGIFNTMLVSVMSAGASSAS